MTTRWNPTLIGALTFFCAILLTTACASSDPEFENQNQQGDGIGDGTGDGGTGDGGTGDGGTGDGGTGDDEDDIIHVEAHQWCTAAGESADGSVTAYNCFGPHDISGFEASGGNVVWQPGAFQIITE